MESTLLSTLDQEELIQLDEAAAEKGDSPAVLV